MRKLQDCIHPLTSHMSSIQIEKMKIWVFFLSSLSSRSDPIKISATFTESLLRCMNMTIKFLHEKLTLPRLSFFFYVCSKSWVLRRRWFQVDFCRLLSLACLRLTISIANSFNCRFLTTSTTCVCKYQELNSTQKKNSETEGRAWKCGSKNNESKRNSKQAKKKKVKRNEEKKRLKVREAQQKNENNHHKNRTIPHGGWERGCCASDS